MPIAGDSLNGDKITEGDVAVIRENFTDADLTPGRLVAVQTPGGLFVRHCYKGIGGAIRLVSSNDNHPDLSYGPGEAQIIGVVARIGRDYPRGDG